MYTTSRDQENAVYQRQTLAAAKPLNQGVKGLAPKTPGQKVSRPGREAFQKDENIPLGAKATGKGAKPQTTAFITPAGPRNRAPLGNKTTNVKAVAFQTPTPATTDSKAASSKPTSPRLKKSKIQIHQPETAVVQPLAEDAEEPEIEYMPPREVPMPDYPDEWPHDRTYPQFAGDNLTRGWYSEFIPRRGSDAESLAEFEEFRRQMRELQAKETASEGAAAAASATKRSKPHQASTIASKTAAAALSGNLAQPRKTGLSFAAPTAAARARLPSSFASKKAADSSRAATGNPRHTAAKVASNTTLGYSKGRYVSAARKPLRADKGAGAGAGKGNFTSSVVKAPSAPPAALEHLFRGLLIETCEESEGANGSLIPTLAAEFDDEELDDFQLDPFEP